MMRRFVVVLLFLPIVGLSQSTFQGVVRDSQTGEPVVGAHVIGRGLRTVGTSTNMEGGFTLHSSGQLDSVRVSCIGYITTVLSLRNGHPERSRGTGTLAIRLTPHVIALSALTVKPPAPQQLIRDAVRAMSRNYSPPPFQLRGFYREIIHRDTLYYSVAEAVFESQLPEGGDDNALLKLVQGRRSETVKSTRIFEDYHPGGGPNYLVNHLLEASLPEFMVESNFEDYLFTIDSISSYEGRDVYLIGFDQRDGLKKNLWKGRIGMDVESLAIIDLRYALSEKGMEYRKHLQAKDQVMAGLLGIDFNVLRKATHYSYRRDGERWQLHEGSLTMDIHFKQPRKDIDEVFTLQANLLSLKQESAPLTSFGKSEVWRKNQLVKNLPGEFDEGFWGVDNIIRPEATLTEAISTMKVLRTGALPKGAPEGWSILHQPEVKVYQTGSALVLKPYVTSRWKDSEQGPFLWQTVSGDFEMQATIRVTKAMDTTRGPDAGFQVGGLMIRAPEADDESHILFAIGCMGNPQLKFISQNTTKGKSATHVTRVEQNEVTMRLRRAGQVIVLSYLSPENGNWVVIRQYARADWPETLQAGIAGYSYVTGSGPNRKPDILVHAEGYTIKGVNP